MADKYVPYGYHNRDVLYDTTSPTLTQQQRYGTFLHNLVLARRGSCATTPARPIHCACLPSPMPRSTCQKQSCSGVLTDFSLSGWPLYQRDHGVPDGVVYCAVVRCREI